MSAIRTATADDFDALVVLELEVFATQAWSPRSVEEELAGLGDTRQIWLAEVPDHDHGQRPVGYAVGRFVDDVADLQRVAVLPSARRNRLGQRLLDEVVAEARRRGCARILLEVAADNAPAVALYARNGFTTIDRRPRYYAGDVDALILALDLTRDSRVEELPARS